MRAVARFIGTDKYELEMTFRMSLEDWKAIKAEMSERWPSWQFGAHIGDAVSRAERQIVSDPQVERTDA